MVTGLMKSSLIPVLSFTLKSGLSVNIPGSAYTIYLESYYFWLSELLLPGSYSFHLSLPPLLLYYCNKLLLVLSALPYFILFSIHS